VANRPRRCRPGPRKPPACLLFDEAIHQRRSSAGSALCFGSPARLLTSSVGITSNSSRSASRHREQRLLLVHLPCGQLFTRFQWVRGLLVAVRLHVRVPGSSADVLNCFVRTARMRSIEVSCGRAPRRCGNAASRPVRRYPGPAWHPRAAGSASLAAWERCRSRSPGCHHRACAFAVRESNNSAECACRVVEELLARQRAMVARSRILCCHQSVFFRRAKHCRYSRPKGEWHPDSSRTRRARSVCPDKDASFTSPDHQFRFGLLARIVSDALMRLDIVMCAKMAGPGLR